MSLRSVVLPTLALLVLLPALSGCENDCQRMCHEIADVWEECGISYGDSELRDCIETYRIPDKELLDTTCSYAMRSHPEEGTTFRADLVSSADDGDPCTTIEDWQRSVGSSD